MLVELDIRDLAITEQVRVAFGPGLTAITGETGAGKSLIIDALQLLLGGRADAGQVRAGAGSARVEGVFDLAAEPLPEPLRLALAEAAVEPDDGALIISREIAAGARSRATARINGRAVVQSALAAIGAQLVEIHGQGEHVQLLASARHVVLLDRFAGTQPLKAALAEPLAQLRDVRAELNRQRTNERERARREERLRFELAEITAAELRADEEDELRAERLLLANAERLAELADAGHSALQGGSRGGSAIDALGRAAEALSELAELDPRLAEDAVAASGLQEQVTDLARTLRSYRESVEHNPRRLAQVEERLALLLTLQRKYGATLAEVLAYGEQIAGEIAGLEHSEERRAALLERERAVLAEAAVCAAALSVARVEGALKLVAAVRGELRDSGLPHARIAVQFTRRAAADGLPCNLPLGVLVEDAVEETDTGSGARLAYDAGGVDRIEFLVTLNPGEPLRPLARVASGGETSRLMLALETVLGDASDVATMVFDEIEQGIGGRSGGVVGAKLAALAETRQIVCITHLPQIAARAQQHLVVSKTVVGERTRTAVATVEGEARRRELAAMLGGVTAANLDSADELLRSGPAARPRASAR